MAKPLPTACLVAALLAASSLSAETADPFLDYLLSTRESVWMADEEIHRLPKPDDINPPAGHSRLAGGFSLSSGYSDYYRPGGMEARSASFGRTISGKAFVSGGGMTDWSLEAGSATRRTAVNIQQDVHQQFISINNDWTKIRLGGSIARRNLAVRAGVDIKTDAGISHYINDNSEPADISVAVRAMAYRDGGVTIRWRRGSDLWRVSADWRGESATVLFPLYYQTYSLSLCFPEVRGVRAFASFGQSNMQERRGTYHIPAIEPTGYVRRYRAGMEWRSGRHSLWVGTRGLAARMEGRGMEEESPFAKITRLDADISAVFAGVETKLAGTSDRSVKCELERLQWDATSRGHVELWPFTSGLVDLLGLRRYFIASSEATLWRIHIAYGGGFKPDSENGGFAWSAGMHLFDIRPSFELDHWRPIYLIFGQDDLQHSELRIYRVMGCIPHIDIYKDLAGFRIGYGFMQVIPVKSWRRSVTGAPAAPVRRGGLPYGGGFHILTLSHGF